MVFCVDSFMIWVHWWTIHSTWNRIFRYREEESLVSGYKRLLYKYLIYI